MVFQIHGEVGRGRGDAGGGEAEMDVEEKENAERGDGVLKGLRNVSLCFSHLENRDRKRRRWGEWKRQ